jgi:ABC-type polysaccharide/polyol phosphate transport system ATPase subunit
MSAPGIVFDGVWKKFRLGERHDSLRDLLPSVVARLTGRTRKAPLEAAEFWAVRDVSFQVGPGRALGIIGPNGAGKSTILKLLVRIMKPTLGTCSLRGRAGALIEVAAGFHPELTGRENIFLQGTIMGMRRAEILRKFDEIVAFSELAEFIDTPVKRYSSGMNARLGFAIAAHLDPDVLIVDEVLAVGDYRFQQKAFGRITEIIRQSIPVAIVSHQLERITSLCTEAILLDRGRIVASGTPQHCVSQYVVGAGLATRDDAQRTGISIESIRLQSDLPVRSGERIRALVGGCVTPPVEDGETVGIRVRALQTGQTIFATQLHAEAIELPSRGAFQLEVDLQANVGRGLYAIETIVWDVVLRREAAAGPQVLFQVHEDQGFFGTVNMDQRLRLTASERPLERVV